MSPRWTTASGWCRGAPGVSVLPPLAGGAGSFPHVEATRIAAEAVVDAGTRCVLTPGVMDVPGWLSWRERLERVWAFHDEHAGAHETVEVGIAAHSAYTLPLEALDAVAAVAQERDALVHIHVAE